MATTHSDPELVTLAIDGNQDAMNTLLERHYDRIHAVCRRIAGSTRDADDATQEALIRVVRYIDRFDGRSSFGTWVYRIATNTSIDELRKRKRRPQLHVVDDDQPGAPDEPTDPDAHLAVDAVADRMAIDDALEQLGDEFRIPVVMREVGGLEYQEIADTLGVPLGTVKSRIARGRKQLVEILFPDGNPTGDDERRTHLPPTEP